MTIDRWIAAISSIGTLVAAFLAFFSIREVRLQRTQQFQPRLTPTTGTFEARTEEKIMWRPPEDEAVESGRSIGATKQYALPLINVGNGVATDLIATWEIDVDGWIQRVNTISAQTGAGIGVQKNDFGLSFLVDGISKAGVRLESTMQQNKEYVLPVAVEKSESYLNIPVAIQSLIHTYYQCYFREVGDRPTVINPEPNFDINLKIEYKDTVGNLYIASCTISAEVFMMTHNPRDNTGVILYSFKTVKCEAR